jgi:N-acetylglucosamine-6-phosphate deacetylase
MDRAVANTVRFTGLTIDRVIPMASTIPAAFLGLPTEGVVTADWNPTTSELRVVRV